MPRLPHPGALKARPGWGRGRKSRCVDPIAGRSESIIPAVLPLAPGAKRVRPEAPSPTRPPSSRLPRFIMRVKTGWGYSLSRAAGAPATRALHADPAVLVTLASRLLIRTF